ncbi:hypothetical protein LR48_Vigan148s000500 [Vigna angularis]|uniref:Uncharacterized protein n=1 Tax=Phaseolus angularis TaxID=3914 RepID=A0A0L9T5M1_PHAAN|nr:hypothetical protein LR48_Vigan148s000500 [Vigna angularis]
MRASLIRTGSLPIPNPVFHGSPRCSLTHQTSLPGDKSHAKFSTISMHYSHFNARRDAPQKGINRASSEGAPDNFCVRRNLNCTGSCSPPPIIPLEEQFFSDANLHKPSYLQTLREDMQSGGGVCDDLGDATVTGGNGGERMKIDAYYEEMLKSNPTDALLLRNYGKFLHEVREPFRKQSTIIDSFNENKESAILILTDDAAILANPSDGELLSLYGALIWETQRDEARAKSYFDQAIHAAPNDCTVLGSYAHFMWEAEEEEELNGSMTEKTGTEMIALNLEWYVRKEDRHRPEIRAAFHMDDGGMSEGSLVEGSKVEKDDDESSDDDTWEVGAEERLRKNNEDLITLNAKIGVLTRELFENFQTPIFTEEDACGTDEEVAGGVDEAPAVGGDEEPEVGRDCGFEQQGDGNAVDDPLGAYTEVRGEDKTAYEDEIVSRSHDKIVCIEIHDDGDEDEQEAVPLVIPPLHSFVGDPSSTVDVDQLYRVVSVREITVYRVVCEIIGQTLSTTSFYTLAPIKYVDNMNRHVWTLHNYNSYLRCDHFGLGDIATADFVYYFRHDCGVIMLKAVEIWDGDDKYNGKSMPQYTTEELLGIKKKYICEWILDNENIRRMEALELYDIF